MNPKSYPKHDVEKAKCKTFLSEYVDKDVPQEKKYEKQLREIANRERKTLDVYMDDVFDHDKDSEFARSVEGNVVRYVAHFEEVADQIIPKTADTAHVKDGTVINKF